MRDPWKRLAVVTIITVVVASIGAWRVYALRDQAMNAQASLSMARGALAQIDRNDSVAPVPVDAAGNEQGPSTQAQVADKGGPQAAPAASLQRLTAACAAIKSADISLRDVRAQVLTISPLLRALDSVPGIGLQTRGQVDSLEVGTSLASAGAEMCQELGPAFGLLAEANSAGPTSVADALRLLVGSREQMASTTSRLGTLQQTLEHARSDLIDDDQRRSVDVLRSRLATMEQTLREGTVLLGLLGGDTPRRFLIVSQNPDEIRATGGYVGSAGIIEARGGSLRLLEYVGSRAYDTPLDLRVPPPEPLAAYLGKGYWQLAGANWSPSFPDSARQMAYFYELSHPGQPIDGVVAVDQYALTLLLDVVGPVDVPEYHETVAAADVQAKLDQYLHDIPFNPDERGRKQFTGALTSAVVERVLQVSGSMLPKLAKATGTALAQQHVLVWVRDPAGAGLLSQKRWDGRMLETNGDYLMLVDSEVSSSKQSQKVRRDARYELDGAAPDGARSRLTVDYTNESQLDRRPGAIFRPIYRTFLRAYVPLGAEMIDSAGFNGPVSMYRECGRSVLAGEVAIPSGSTTQVVLSYRLPKVLTGLGIYNFVLQQQPGAPPGQTVVGARWADGVLSDVGRPNGNGGHAFWRVDMMPTPHLVAEMPTISATRECAESPTLAQKVVAPVSIEIPSIGVVAPVQSLGVSPNGVMATPEDADVVGWYSMSARAGQPGNLVLSGHLDKGPSPAVFWNARKLRVNDVIMVRGGDDVVYRYAIRSNTSYPTREVPIDEILRGSDDALFTIITCDGVFDRQTNDYRNRRIIRGQLIA